MTSAWVARMPHVVWLLVVWIALWGEISVANLLSGAIVAGVVAVVFRDVGPRPAAPVRARAVASFVGFFVVALVTSTWQVAKAVVVGADIRPVVIAFTLRHVSDAVATTVANSITLTPGTLTLDVRHEGDDAVLYVHVFDAAEIDAVRAELDDLARHVVMAFGDREAVDHYTGDHA